MDSQPQCPGAEPPLPLSKDPSLPPVAMGWGWLPTLLAWHPCQRPHMGSQGVSPSGSRNLSEPQLLHLFSQNNNIHTRVHC